MSEWNETCSQAPANKVIAELRAELVMLREAHRVDGETELNSITEIMRLGAALDQTTGERDALRGVLQEVRSLMHSDSVMSGRRWYFSSARGERVNQVCRQVFAVLENSSPQSPAPAPEGPECPACDDGLVWHEKEPGFQQWSTPCGVCGGTGRSK